MTIAYVVGIFGRNFGNSRSVIIQIFVPGCRLPPRCCCTAISTTGSSPSCSDRSSLPSNSSPSGCAFTLLDAVVATRDMTLLARRFDTALNNMPHALCMFDAERRIVVANKRLNEHLGLPADPRAERLPRRRSS